VAPACFWGIVAVFGGNRRAFQKNFSKRKGFCKISLCKMEKMGYNKMEEASGK
jgi:hypothetical protein